MRERATVVQDELSAANASVMEKRGYFLTLVAAVFLPLSFLTGLMGTNVGGIPGATHPRGFVIEVAVVILIAVLSIWWLKRQRWM